MADPFSSGLTVIFENFFKESDYVFFVYQNHTNQFSYVSKSVERLLNHPYEDVLLDAQSSLMLVEKDHQELVQNYFNALYRGEKKGPIEFSLTAAQGKKQWLELQGTAEHCNSEKCTISGIVKDITVKREYNEYLERYSSKKNAVLEILSHDLQGPLGTIRNYNQVLLEYVKPFAHNEVEKIISRITSVADKAIHLIREFIKEEFLESTYVKLNKSRIDLVEKMRTVIQQYQDSSEDLHKTFH